MPLFSGIPRAIVFSEIRKARKHKEVEVLFTRLWPFCFYAGPIMRRIGKAAREAKTCSGGSVEGPGAADDPGAAED